MSRPISTDKGEKRVTLTPRLLRAFVRAKLHADDHSESFPTLNEALDKALEEWLRNHHPHALTQPGPGRPRKTPDKK